MASPEKVSSLNLVAAASAFEMVGLEIITAFAFSHFDNASKCTRPIRPAPMTPTPRMPLSDSFMLTCPNRRDVTPVSSAARPNSKHRQSTTISRISTKALRHQCKVPRYRRRAPQGRAGTGEQKRAI
eukprot:scaffold77814_cov67-Phaeocystis_antarctica.AAC.17